MIHGAKLLGNVFVCLARHSEWPVVTLRKGHVLVISETPPFPLHSSRGRLSTSEALWASAQK